MRLLTPLVLVLSLSGSACVVHVVQPRSRGRMVEAPTAGIARCSWRITTVRGRVKTRDGRVMYGPVDCLDETTLTIQSQPRTPGALIQVVNEPMSNVVEIAILGDSVVDGMLKGMLLGSAALLGGGDQCTGLQDTGACVIVLTMTGAAIGAAIDAWHGRTQVLYRAP